MLDIKDKLPITEQDLQYFKDEWMKTVTPPIIVSPSPAKLEWIETLPDNLKNDLLNNNDEVPSYQFNLYENIITAHYQRIVYESNTRSTAGSSFDYVKMQQSFKDHPTYHCYNRNIVFDNELFFMENCKHDQKRLEGVK